MGDKPINNNKIFFRVFTKRRQEHGMDENGKLKHNSLSLNLISFTYK